MSADLGIAVVGFIALTGVFIILLGPVILWYWRINEVVGLLHSIDRHLELMAPSREPEAEYGPEDE